MERQNRVTPRDDRILNATLITTDTDKVILLEKN